ncbi:MAG: nucleotidyltransferase family protein [Candidatus Omnitrophota bacterium]|jgi:hypothetical protein
MRTKTSNIKNSREFKLISMALCNIINEQASNGLKGLLNDDNIDWNLLGNLLFYHEIAPFFYIAVKSYKDLLPSDTKRALSWAYYRQALQNQLIFEVYSDIYDAFKLNGIGLLPIKGTALLYDLYAEFPVRPMSDIDCLIREADYKKSKDILKSINYDIDLRGLSEAYWMTKQCHVPFSARQQAQLAVKPAVEVHLRLDFKRYGREPLPHVWQRTRDVNMNGKYFLQLSPEDTLFSLALHQRRFGKTVCLKYALDTAFLFKKYGDNFDWDYTTAACRKERMRDCVYFLLFQASLLSKCPGIVKGLRLLMPNVLKSRMIEGFIGRNVVSGRLSGRLKSNYLHSHFLLYDSFMEPFMYIINIPKEQFAKYYCLPFGSKKTEMAYRFRLLYMIGRF